MAEAVAHEWVVLDKPGVELHHVLLTFRAYEVTEGDDAYEAICDELEVASSGPTIGDALGNVVEATLLYLNTLEELGERRRVFDERDLDFDRGMPPVVPHAASRAAEPVPIEVGETVQRHLLALR